MQKQYNQLLVCFTIAIQSKAIQSIGGVFHNRPKFEEVNRRGAAVEGGR